VLIQGGDITEGGKESICHSPKAPKTRSERKKDFKKNERNKQKKGRGPDFEKKVIQGVEKGGGDEACLGGEVKMKLKDGNENGKIEGPVTKKSFFINVEKEPRWGGREREEGHE